MYGKWLTYQKYLNEYMKLSNTAFADIEAWILPVAAAKLKDMIPVETIWLNAVIHKYLKKFDV
jgi:hypothetical protein